MTPERLAEAARKLAEFDPVIARAVRHRRALAGEFQTPEHRAMESTHKVRILIELLNGPQLASEIATTSGLTMRAVSSCLAQMHPLVRHHNKADVGRAFYWAITPEGRALLSNRAPA